MLQMQQQMLMKNNADDERRRLEEKKGMLELQVQVKNLEELLANKQVQGGADVDRPRFKKPVILTMNNIPGLPGGCSPADILYKLADG